MKNQADIRWLGNLSKIEFDENGLKKMTGDMESIMELMDSLLGVEAVSYDGGGECASLKTLRADEVKDSFEPSLLVSQSKGATENGFVIQKVL